MGSAESGEILRNVEEEKEETQKITLRVKWVNGNDSDNEEEDGEHEKEKEKERELEAEEVYLNINNDMPLRWLMIKYCDKIGVKYCTTRFEFKGARLRETDTPLLLSMLPCDLIQAYHFIYGGLSSVNYATVCIRMYKEQDKFVRVRRASPLLPQLIRGFSDVGSQKEASSLSFVFDGSRLNQKVTADELDIEDGDIIDAFNFDDTSSSLSIVTSRLTLTVINNETNKDVQFALNWGVRLNRLMDRYCKFEGLQLDNVAFFHEGCRLTGSKTVAEERLDNGDEIYAYIIG